MKKHVLYLGLVIFTSVLLVGHSSVVRAEDSASVDETQQTTTTAAEEESTTDASASAEPKDRSSGREARISAYKEKVATKLAESKAKRISTRCVAAQTKITSLRERISAAVVKRQEAYDKIGEKLDALTAKLVAAGVDTAPLETAREDVRADLAVLAESMASYDTVLADLIAFDCASDPQTFYTALESARETQKSLREQAQEFRRFATAELRTVIQNMKTELEKVNTTDGGQ